MPGLAARRAGRGRRGGWAGRGLLTAGRERGHQLVARQLHGLGGALFIDELLIGRLLAGLHEPSIVVGNDLVGIPFAAVLRAEHVETA